MRFLTALLALAASALFADSPPAGFTPLFNGKDLAGWHGYNPHSVAKLSGEKKDAMLAKMREEFPQHWSVKDGELFNPGTGAYATTDKEYGDIELLLEYNMAPLGDSGVYLRACPQVQIWDPANPKELKNNANLGSGALWNNSKGAPGKDPLILADKAPGEWNTMRILMVGSRVSVWLNGKQTVDHAILENYYDRKAAIPAKGPICLQTHGASIRWRNVSVREIAGAEANQILASHGNAGFKSIFNGKDLTDWRGAVEEYEVVDGAIYCKPKKGGNLYHKDDLKDFSVRSEIKIPAGGNNGFCIRYPGQGNTAYVGMCEIQVLDDNYEKVKGKIDPRQAHGSAYGMVAAQRGYQRPLGEWNFEEVTVIGPTIKVELNGYLILDCDLSKVDMAAVMAKSAHPGKDNTHGYFGFAGHNDPVGFRNLSVKTIEAK
jgi:hypothetical protein